MSKDHSTETMRSNSFPEEQTRIWNTVIDLQNMKRQNATYERPYDFEKAFILSVKVELPGLSGPIDPHLLYSGPQI